MENKEEIISEEIAFQIEEMYKGLWWLICESNEKDGITNEDIKKKYEQLKQSHKRKHYRLLKWSKVLKYEIVDGEGF